MNDIQKRFFLFLFICVPLRLMFVYLVTQVTTKDLKMLGYISILPALGFIYIYMTGSRKKGIETQGDEIWWNSLRPIHSLLYFLFAYTAINNMKDHVYKPLLADIILGLISFLVYHKKIDNFKYLFN